MYREGQSRGRPNETEGGRTVVRIATPASVLQPRPRSTVHDFRAPPVLFFPRSSQRQKKRNVRSKGGLRFPGGDACYLSTEGSWSIDRRNERKPARKNLGRFSGGIVFPPLFVAGKMAAVAIPPSLRIWAFESLTQ